MIIIPERALVVLQPPRAASTSTRAAILERYKGAQSLFRHMERDGIPDAYAHYDVACLVRHPLTRLHSLWRYMRAQRPEDHSDKAWALNVAQDANRPFEDWLVNSTDPFNKRPESDIPNPGYYDIRHYLPATRKSLKAWARPDLGPVEPLKIEDVAALEARLDIRLPHLNAAPKADMPTLNTAARQVLATYHAWDLALYSPAAEHAAALMPETAET